MAITIRELVTKLGFKVDLEKMRQFDNRIEASKKNVETLTNKLNAMGDTLTRAGKTMSLFVTLPILGAGAAFIKAASDAEEAESKFNTVFNDVSEGANNAARSLVKNFGLSRDAAKTLLGDTGDLLSGFGFTGQKALELSRAVNELAVDLASFTNYSGGTEGASKALTKALIGERETVKSLGIAILEKDVKDRVSLMESKGMRFETERQAKAYATLAIAQEQSKNAIGDFARTSKQFANRLRIFKARINDIAVAFGKILLPTANKVLEKIIVIIEKIDKLSPTAKKMILIFAGITAAVGPVLIVFGGILSLIASMILKFVALKATLTFFGLTLKGVIGSMSLFALKFALIAGAIAAVGIALALLIEDIYVWTKGGDSLTGELLGPWVNFKDSVKTIFNDIKETLKAFFDGDLIEFQNKMEFWSQSMKFFFEDLGDDIETLFGGRIADFFRRVGDFITRMSEAIGSSLGTFVSDPKQFFQEWADLFNSIDFGTPNISSANPNPVNGALDTLNKRNVDSISGFTRPAGFNNPIQSNKNFNVDVKATLNLPEGTTEMQQRILQTQGKEMVEKALNQAINQAILANPVRE